MQAFLLEKFLCPGPSAADGGACPIGCLPTCLDNLCDADFTVNDPNADGGDGTAYTQALAKSQYSTPPLELLGLPLPRGPRHNEIHTVSFI